MLLKLQNTLFPIYKTSRNVCRAISISTHRKEKAVKIKDWNINYVKVGTGDHHVLFLPGILGTKWTHGKQIIEGFNREKFTVIAWDPPGCGKSRPPEKECKMDYYEKDADIAHEFMKELGVSNYSLLGFSGGGMSSLIQAAKYPEAVNKLVVWSVITSITPHELKTYSVYTAKEAWSDVQMKPLVEIYGEETFFKYITKWVAAMNEIYTKKAGNICLDYLERIKCPTLLLYGQKDLFMDLKTQMSQTLKGIKNSRVHVYPDGKHHIHITHAEDFNQRVQQFLLQP